MFPVNGDNNVGDVLHPSYHCTIWNIVLFSSEEMQNLNNSSIKIHHPRLWDFGLDYCPLFSLSTNFSVSLFSMLKQECIYENTKKPLQCIKYPGTCTPSELKATGLIFTIDIQSFSPYVLLLAPNLPGYFSELIILYPFWFRALWTHCLAGTSSRTCHSFSLIRTYV